MVGRASAYSGATELGNRKIRAYTGISLVIDFELNREGFRKIAVSDEMRRAVDRVVRDRALPYAIAISPYDARSKGPHYRDSFVIRQGFETVAGLRRVATRLFNISDHAVEVEWINESHVLGKTLAHLLQESVIAELLKQHGRQHKFNPKQHPRGAKGRFVPKRDTAAGGAGRAASNAGDAVKRIKRGRKNHDPEDFGFGD